MKTSNGTYQYPLMNIFTRYRFNVDRRSGRDRRNQSRFNIRSLFIGGQRETIRRQEDTYKFFYVDRYSQILFVLITTILFLSVLDALLTLFLFNNGATEINPIMAYCLSHGPSTFILIKYAITCISVLILLVLSNVFIMRIKIYTRTIFGYVIGVFSCVILWELFLIYRYVV